MDFQAPTPFIFYLTLGEQLPNTFFTFDRILKDLGFILVPIQVDQLQSLVSAADQSQVVVIASVSDIREMKLYNHNVRKLLKYILKSKRISLMHLSSFSRLNDSKLYNIQKNYYFMRYPVDARVLSAKIARYYELKTQQSSNW